MLWIFMVLFILAFSSFGAYLVRLYNKLIELRNYVDLEWNRAGIERDHLHRILPKLEDVLRPHQIHDFTIVDMRKGQERMPVAEIYPAPRSDAIFNKLSDAAIYRESALNSRLNYFENAVYRYHTTIQKFPTSFFASLMGFETKENLEFPKVAEVSRIERDRILKGEMFQKGSRELSTGSDQS